MSTFRNLASVFHIMFNLIYFHLSKLLSAAIISFECNTLNLIGIASTISNPNPILTILLIMMLAFSSPLQFLNYG